MSGQFYTNPQWAQRCYDALLANIPFAEGELQFVEPSAGDGVFYDLLPPYRRVGMDLDPRHKSIIKADFLRWQPRRGRAVNRVAVGNPPFGKRGALAMQFARHAAEFADTIAFILPMCFRKHAMHKKIPDDMRLILEKRLPFDAFRLPDGSPYGVNTVFQIWTRHSCGRDMRRRRPEPISHPDFALYQYNNTRQALRVFKNDFDFAVPCQGWQDYTRKETSPAKCEKNKQWMLIKARTRRVLGNLRRLDFAALAMNTATAVPGFRKGDLVNEYGVTYG